MKRSDEFLANPTLVSLIDAAAIGDAETFRDGVNQLQESGWDGIDRIVAENFVAEFQSRLGSHPTVGDIVNLSQALYPFTSMFLNASALDLEFLIRGYAGAAVLAEMFPRNVAVAVQLAMLGAVERVSDFRLGQPAYDFLPQ